MYQMVIGSGVLTPAAASTALALTGFGLELAGRAGARLAGDTFVIPLTFGNRSDWSRNVRAAGGCSIRLNGVDYQADRPHLADRAQAGELVRAAFSPVERATFLVLGIRQFLLLQRAPNPMIAAK